jgi:hypothetical protein
LTAIQKVINEARIPFNSAWIINKTQKLTIMSKDIEEAMFELLEHLNNGAQIWYHKDKQRYLVKEYDSVYYEIDGDNEFVLA